MIVRALLGLLLTGQALAGDDPKQPQFPAGSGGVNAPWQQAKPYVVLVSVDGYRWDYPDLYPTPAIGRLIAAGQRAERLVPVWPSLTFPNHYTLVTGQPPARHGLVANDFFDPDLQRWYRLRDRTAVGDGAFYLAEPLWVTAEQQGMVTASFYWVGSEAPVRGVQPSHWRTYDKSVSGADRVRQVLDWLGAPALSRPHFVTLYFEAVDDNAHWYGPGSPEFLAALERVDQHLGALLDGIDRLPHAGRVNLVLVSDHGQMPYLDQPPLVLDAHVDLAGLELIDGGAYVLAWQAEPDPAAARALAGRINAVWTNGRAHTRASAPADWGLRDSPRAPHLVFQASPGHAVVSTAKRSDKIIAGDHGWAPDAPEMHGVFMAMGPAFEGGASPGALHVSDIYPMLLEILALEAPAQ